MKARILSLILCLLLVFPTGMFANDGGWVIASTASNQATGQQLTAPAFTDQQTNGLVALEAIQNVITLLAGATGQPILPGSVTGGWTGSVTSSAWALTFHGQIDGSPVDLAETGTSTGGLRPILTWTDTGNAMGSMIQGSGEAKPDPREVAGVDWHQNLSITPSADGGLSGSFDVHKNLPTIVVVIVIGIQFLVCIFAPKLCGEALEVSNILLDFTVDSHAGPPLSMSDYTNANFGTGAVYTQSIVHGPSGFGLVQQGTIAFGGSGDVSLVNSVQTALFSDLLPPGDSIYQCCNGWQVSGSGAEGGSFTAANKFQVITSGSVSQIDVAVGYVSGDNSFFVALYTDNGGQPGSELAVFTNLSSSTNFGDCCGLVTISGISGLTLNAGTNYWMVIGPTDPSSTTWEEWNWNNLGVNGLDLYSTDGGLTWNSRGQQTLGAFDILPSTGSSSIVKK
jgi:hypothetical protein